MSQREKLRSNRKQPTARALRFSPAKQTDDNPISSVKKPKRGKKVVPQSPPPKQVQRPTKRTRNGRNQSPEQPLPPPPVEMVTTPPKLRILNTQVQKRDAKGAKLSKANRSNESAGVAPTKEQAAEAARTANPPRPPPELPEGFPLPPIPQDETREATPENSHVPEGVKGNTLLTSIFSPMYQLFHRDDQKSNGSDSDPDTAHNVGKRMSRSRSRSRSLSHSPLANQQKAHELRVSERISDAQEPVTSRVLQHSTLEKGACSGEAPGEEVSTDGEDETCLNAQPDLIAGSRDAEEESESESEGDEDFDRFDAFAFIKALPPLEDCVPKWRRRLLPKKTDKRKTLVLDMDETLVHSTLTCWEPDENPEEWNSSDLLFKMAIDREVRWVTVRQRPHLPEFLQKCAELFEVVVFTASLSHYADKVLDEIDPERKLIAHRFFRESCVLVDGNYMKDLSVLGRDLSQIMIIDNSPQAFGFQLANGIPIQSWFDDENDNELLKMMPFLERLADVTDVRPIISNAFQLQKLVEQADVYDSPEVYSDAPSSS